VSTLRDMTQPLTPRNGPEDVAARVAVAVRGLMDSKRMSGRQLAGAAGIEEATLARRVRGDLPGFRLDEAVRVAEALDVTVSDLVGDKRTPEEQP
jgi:DNA-binding Xre family transcriptional regulator